MNQKARAQTTTGKLPRRLAFAYERQGSMRRSDIERGGPSPGGGPTKKEHVAWRKPEPAAGLFERTAGSHQHLTFVGIDQPQCGLGRCVGDSPVVTSAARHENDHVLAIELLGYEAP